MKKGPRYYQSYCFALALALILGLQRKLCSSVFLHDVFGLSRRLMATVFAGLARLSTQSDIPLQVAAVCYRLDGDSVEFLLVNTSSGKWTFPKGRINPSLS